MSRSTRKKLAVSLFAVVFLVAFATEDADSSRRRRKVACNSTGKVQIHVQAYGAIKAPPFKSKSYSFNRKGACGVRSGRCRYVGPNAQKLFKEWKTKYASDANKLRAFFWRYPPGSGRSWGTININCVCQGQKHYLFQGKMWTNPESSLNMSKR